MRILSLIISWSSFTAFIFLLAIFLNWSLDQFLKNVGLDVSPKMVITVLGVIIGLGLLSIFLRPKKTNKTAKTFFSSSERLKQPEPDRYNLSVNNDGDKIILTMSGGGIKAGLFHLGGLRALNNHAILSQIAAFSSVSGGSITNAWLAINWSKLIFDDTGIASNFDEVIFDPLFKYFTQKSVSILDLILGFLPFSSIAERLANSLDRNLYKGATLSEFPDPATGPEFFIASTDMRTNTAWYFGRDKNGPVTTNYKLGIVREDFTLGQAVSASAAFPPFISPFVIKLKTPMKPSENLSRLLKEDSKLANIYLNEMILGDGGIYDNLGAEKIKRFGTVFISNASSPVKIVPNYAKNWLSQYDAIASRVHRQVEQRRKIHLVDLSVLEKIKLHIWEMDDIMDKAAANQFDGLEFEAAWMAGTYKVRLSPIAPLIAKDIVKHGESLARRELQETHPN